MVTQQPNNLTFKFLIVGDSNVGKTSLVHSLRDNTFDESVDSTVGIEFSVVRMVINDTKVNLQIWDTAGQELYRSLSRSYYRDAVGVLLLFAYDNHTSFEFLDAWMEDIKNLCHPKARVLLVCNKADIVEGRQITKSEIDQLAKSYGIEYIETSAKTNYKVHEAFYKVAESVLNGVLTKDIVFSQPNDPMPNQANQGKRGCC